MYANITSNKRHSQLGQYWYKIAEQIGLCAQKHGWESYIAYGRMMNPSKNQLIKVGNRLDVYLHYAYNRFMDGEGLGSICATKKLLKDIDRIQPDVIHLHNIHNHYPILQDENLDIFFG